MSSGLPKLDVEGLESFIPEAEIQELLSKKTTDIKKVREIIAKSLDKNRLNPEKNVFMATESFCLLRFILVMTVSTTAPIAAFANLTLMWYAKP